MSTVLKQANNETPVRVTDGLKWIKAKTVGHRFRPTAKVRNNNVKLTVGEAMTLRFVGHEIYGDKDQVGMLIESHGNLCRQDGADVVLELPARTEVLIYRAPSRADDKQIATVFLPKGIVSIFGGHIVRLRVYRRR